METKQHYENHLANFYTWMIGDFEKAKNSFKDFCVCNAIKPDKSKNAIDLGAGNGIQSVALAEIGFKVKAVDFSKKLLFELKTKINTLPIEVIEDDITNIKKFAHAFADVIVCCGDTISHLRSFEQLDKLIHNSFDLLEQKGYLLLTFRDYTFALTDTQRFIPVKSDENRILTCVIDYSNNKITVTDVLYEKNNGTWIQKISSYNKLRIRSDYVINKTKEAGFSVIKNENKNGMLYLLLKKQ